MTSKRRLIGRDVLQRRVAALGLLVDEHRVALREGAALAVLAGQADREAFVEQRAEGQVLGHRPVDAVAGLDHLAAALEQALDGLVGVEVGGMAVMRRPTFFSVSMATPVLPRRASSSAKTDAGPAAVEPVGLVRPVAVGVVELVVEMRAERRPSSPRPPPAVTTPSPTSRLE